MRLACPAVEPVLHEIKSRDQSLVPGSVILSYQPPYAPTVLPTVGPMDYYLDGLFLSRAAAASGPFR